MSVSMFVGASQSQASSVLAKSQHDQQAYETMLQALQQFVDEGRLVSIAYINAKGFYSSVLIPLTKAGILLSEAVGEACQKFVQDYQSTVDSGDLKSDELEEKIRQLDTQIGQIDAIRATIESKDLADNFKIRQLNQNSKTRDLLTNAKQVLQEKLDKLMDFHGTSPAIFSSISELEAIVNQGAAQAGSSFTGSGFSLPSDLGWTTNIAEKWQVRADTIKKKEKEAREAKINELKKYNVYAMPYEDPETKEAKIMWFIDKDGVRVFDKDLQDFVERYGKDIEGIYEVVSWEKIYELDLAARRKGNGKNYLNENQLPDNWKVYGLVGTYWESAYWMGNKTGLLDLALAAGLVYVDKKLKTSNATKVPNVLDDLDDVGKKTNGAKPAKTDFGAENLVSGNEWNNYFKDKYGINNVGWKNPVTVDEIFDSPSSLFGKHPNDVVEVLKNQGWTVGPLKHGGKEGIPFNQGGGYSMNPPSGSGSSRYIQFHPGGGHHGERSYYKISAPNQDIVRIYQDGEYVLDYGGPNERTYWIGGN